MIRPHIPIREGCKWKLDSSFVRLNDDGFEVYYFKSECGKKLGTEDIDEFDRWAFCPYCGKPIVVEKS